MILLSSIQPTNSHERKSVPSHYYCNRVYFLLFSNKKQQSGPNLPTSPALTCPPLCRSDGTDEAVFSVVGASRMTIGEPTLSVGFASPDGVAPPFGAHRTATTLPTLHLLQILILYQLALSIPQLIIYMVILLQFDKPEFIETRLC
jgi:hypothetical protein